MQKLVSWRTAYLITKHHTNGAIEFIEGYIKENDARYAASKHISHEYTISLTTFKLIGSFEMNDEEKQ